MRTIEQPQNGNGSGSEAALRLLESISAVPEVLIRLDALNASFDALRADIHALKAAKTTKESGGDCWLDAKAAADYLSLSPGSFDKYRYKTTPKITGSNLDGKTLYKKSELDTFVKLYAVKSGGLA